MRDGDFIFPDWPAPTNVGAAITTRHGGVSQADYAQLNLADHVGDRIDAVNENRRRVMSHLGLAKSPVWLQQIHGCTVIDVAKVDHGVRADGSVAFDANSVCAVLTADCLPILLTDKKGGKVAALHAGWRGLANGIVEAGIKMLMAADGELISYLGPAIGPNAFEVGNDVYDQFCRDDAQAESAFQAITGDKWLADLYELARMRLQRNGVGEIYGGGRCTYNETTEFFSYRRDHHCGRMAAMIWING